MPSPFPGMDPYLEHPDFWPEVHHWLITLIAETLVPQVRPKYRVAIEKRIYEISQPEESSNGNSLVPFTTAVAQPQTVIVPMPDQVKQAI